MLVKMWRNRTLFHCCWEYKLIQLLWRMVWRYLKTPGIKLLYDPTIPSLCTYLKEAVIERDTCTSMFTAALFPIARAWKQPRCPSTDEWIKKLWHIYTMEYYSALKRTTFESVPWDGKTWNLLYRVKYIRETSCINVYTRNLERWYWLSCLQGGSGDADIEDRLVGTGGKERVGWIESIA